MAQVFISYSRKDLVFVERLARDLEAAGLDVWYDLSGLEVGTRWGLEIQDAIRKSRYIIIVLSPNSVVSEWVEREFIYASNHKLKIIPLIYKPCDLPLWSVTMHYIDMHGKNYRDHFGELLKVLGLQLGRKLEKLKPAVEVGTTHELSGSQELVPEILEGKAGTPPLPQVQLPVEHAPAVKEKAPQREKSPLKEPTRPRRKIKIHPAWILIPAGLVAVIAFAVWGMPPLAALLAPIHAPTATVAHIPTSIRTATATHAPTPTRTSTPTLTRISSPSPTLGIGSIWTSPLDLMVMVYVPEGDFSMGSNNWRLDEQPVHTVYLDAFWIDQIEVTNRMYTLCMAEGACLTPANSSYCGSSGFDNCPVANVDWNMAEAYCRWAGRRLPTEAEWEKAARGTDGRTYPWGNSSPTCSLATLLNLGYGTSLCESESWLELTIGGSHPAGASPYGALDMAGNVWEWVNDWYSASYYSQSPEGNPTGPASGNYHVLRGVSWMQNIESVRSAYRFGFGDNYDVGGHLGIGFRCARGAQP